MPQEAQAGANAVAAPKLEAGKMVSQLDVLLMKAAKVSTQSLDGKQVKNKLQKLVTDGALSRDSLNLLAKTADTAAKTLKALDKFTGRQLAEAFDKKGDFDASTKVGKAIAAAVKAQQDLSDLLAQLSTNLDAMSRHERMVVAKDIMKALERAVANAEELFKTARHEVMRKVIVNYAVTAKSVLSEEPGYENQFGYVDAAHINGFECRDDVLEAMDALAEAAKDPSKTKKELNALYSDLCSKGKRLMEAAKNAKWVNTPSATRLNKLFGRFSGIGTVIEGLGRIIGSMYGNDQFFTGAEAMAVFQGKLSVSSVVEARARGLQDSDVDPANEDANIVSKRLLEARRLPRLHPPAPLAGQLQRRRQPPR